MYKRQNLAQVGQDSANLEPRWRQELPSWGQDGHLEAIWGAFLSIFGGLGSDLLKNGRSVKTNNSPSFLMVFRFGARLGGFRSSFGECLGTVLEDFGQDGEQERQDGDQDRQAQATYARILEDLGGPG